MLYLPTQLKALALAASKGDGGRVGMNGIRILEYDGGYYRLDATDGRILAIARGQAEFSKTGSLVNARVEDVAPFGVFECVVPLDKYLEAFGMAKKGDDGVLFSAGDSLFGQPIASFSTLSQTLETPFQEKRFPNTDAVLPKWGGLASVAFNPAYMAKLMKLAEGLGVERIELHFTSLKPGVPVVMTGKSANAPWIILDLLLMPLDVAKA